MSNNRSTREIVHHGDQGIDKARKWEEEVQEQVEDFDRARRIFQEMGEPALLEQAEQLERLHAELGDAGFGEVEEVVQRGEAQCDEIMRHEQALEQAGMHEERNAEQLAQGRAEVKSDRLGKILEDQEQVRREGADWLGKEQQRVGRERQAIQESLQRQQDHAASMRRMLKKGL